MARLLAEILTALVVIFVPPRHRGAGHAPQERDTTVADDFTCGLRRHPATAALPPPGSSLPR